MCSPGFRIIVPNILAVYVNVQVATWEINTYICGVLRVFSLAFCEILVHISFILYNGRNSPINCSRRIRSRLRDGSWVALTLARKVSFLSDFRASSTQEWVVATHSFLLRTRGYFTACRFNLPQNLYRLRFINLELTGAFYIPQKNGLLFITALPAHGVSTPMLPSRFRAMI